MQAKQELRYVVRATREGDGRLVATGNPVEYTDQMRDREDLFFCDPSGEITSAYPVRMSETPKPPELKEAVEVADSTPEASIEIKDYKDRNRDLDPESSVDPELLSAYKSLPMSRLKRVVRQVFGARVPDGFDKKAAMDFLDDQAQMDPDSFIPLDQLDI